MNDTLENIRKMARLMNSRFNLPGTPSHTSQFLHSRPLPQRDAPKTAVLDFNVGVRMEHSKSRNSVLMNRLASLQVKSVA